MADSKSAATVLDMRSVLDFEAAVRRRAAKPKVLSPGRMRLKRQDEITPTDEDRARIVCELSSVLDEVVNSGVAWPHFLVMLEQIAEQHPALGDDLRAAACRRGR